MSAERIETDVLVVGGGPGGAAAAYHLARHGIDVTVVDKAAFPREKVCGDGLTPRSVAAHAARWASTPTTPASRRVKGLRVHSRTTTIELPVARAATWPDYGLVMPRARFDQLLAASARRRPARG